MYRDIFGKQLSSLIWDAVLFDWGITIQDQSKDRVVFFFFFFLEENISKCRKIKQWSSEAKGISAQWVMGVEREVPPMEEHRTWSSQKRATQKCKIPTQRSFGKSMTQQPGRTSVLLLQILFSAAAFPSTNPHHKLAQPFPLVKNRQDGAKNGCKSSMVAQWLSHRYFQNARVKDVPSQLSIGATGTHLLVPKLLLLPQRVQQVPVLIMNSALHPSAPAAPTKTTYSGREMISCALQAQGIHTAPRAEKKVLNIYSLFSNEST